MEAQLGTVPNQPLAFDGDGVPRWEDDLVGYNWTRSLTRDGPSRLVLDAITKSAVRAMDTVTAIMTRPEWGGPHLERVEGIAPIVFDVLNMEASLRHRIATYGRLS